MKVNPFAVTIIYSLFILQHCAAIETKVFHYVYDNNGNTLTVDQTVNNRSNILDLYSYNNLNQMANFEDIQNNKAFTYRYYPNGKRFNKKGSSELGQEEIVFYYGHSGRLMNEVYLKDNQPIKQSNYFSGLRFINNVVNGNNNHLQYLITDRHDHPVTINFNQKGSSIESYDLTDYGKLEQSHHNSSQIENDMNSKKISELFNFELNAKIYGNGYYDSESKLQYMGARYYSADTQRFMAQDSYNLLNRYNYANGNPVMKYDLDGHIAVGGFTKSLVPHGVSGGIGLGVSIVVDIAVTGMALGANPSLGTLMMVGAISGGLSNGLGTAAAESVELGTINAGDVRTQVLLGAAIGGVIAGGLPVLSKAIYRYRSNSYKAREPAPIPLASSEESSLSHQSEEDVLDWNYVVKHGIRLSNGAYGEVYALNGRVYKMIKAWAQDKTYANPWRAKRYWNLTFKNIYDGIYAEYATADVVSMRGVDVLSTPDLRDYLISETNLLGDEVDSVFKFIRLKRALGYINGGIEISDLHEGNIIQIGYDDLIPIDYDHAYQRNARRRSIGTEDFIRDHFVQSR